MTIATSIKSMLFWRVSDISEAARAAELTSVDGRPCRPQVLHVHGEIAIIIIAHEQVLVSQTLLLVLQIALCIAGKTRSPRAALSARELPWMVSMHHKSHITWSPKCCGGRVV